MPRRRSLRDDPDPPVGTSPYPVLFPGIDQGGQVYTEPEIPGPPEGQESTSLRLFQQLLGRALSGPGPGGSYPPGRSLSLAPPPQQNPTPPLGASRLPARTQATGNTGGPAAPFSPDQLAIGRALSFLPRPSGVPSAEQEALREPAIDPVFLASGMVGGGVGALGDAEYSAMSDVAKEVMNRETLGLQTPFKMALQAAKTPYYKGTVPGFARGALGQAWPNIFSQLINSHVFPGSVAAKALALPINAPGVGLLETMSGAMEKKAAPLDWISNEAADWIGRSLFSGLLSGAFSGDKGVDRDEISVPVHGRPLSGPGAAGLRRGQSS